MYVTFVDENVICDEWSTAPRCWVAFAINLIIWYARCIEREQCQAQAFYLWSRCLIKWKFQTDQIFRSFTYTYKSTHHFLSLDKNNVQIL